MIKKDLHISIIVFNLQVSIHYFLERFTMLGDFFSPDSEHILSVAKQVAEAFNLIDDTKGYQTIRYNCTYCAERERMKVEVATYPNGASLRWQCRDIDNEKLSNILRANGVILLKHESDYQLNNQGRKAVQLADEIVRVFKLNLFDSTAEERRRYNDTARYYEGGACDGSIRVELVKTGILDSEYKIKNNINDEVLWKRINEYIAERISTKAP